METGTKVKLPFASLPDFDELVKDEKYWAVRDVLDKIAEKKGLLPHKSDHTTRTINNKFLVISDSPLFAGKSVAQVALRWLLQTPPVTAVIVGARKISQLEDNMGAVGWKLTKEEVEYSNQHRFEMFMQSRVVSKLKLPHLTVMFLWTTSAVEILQMEELNEVSSIELPYPYKQQALFQGDRIKSPAFA